MTLANKQITFRKPSEVSNRINEGIRAVAENYQGNIQGATEHCLDRVEGLSEARLVRMRGNRPPDSTRDGQSFITLIWVLLVDGLIPRWQPGAVREWLIKLLEATDLFEGNLTDDDLPALIELFTQSTRLTAHTSAPSFEVITQTIRRIWAANASTGDGTRLMPALNRVFIGREDDLQALHRCLGVADKSDRHALTIVRGWPGVGKTALINAVVHDKEVEAAFADGVLWAGLGQHGKIFDLYVDWAKQLGALHLLQLKTLAELLPGLRAVLAGRDILIIADDIWTAEQGQYVKNVVDLKSNTLLLTTRFTDVANQLKDLPDDVYVLKTLPENHALSLLDRLAPEPVRKHQARMPQLVRVLEGLPLALRVAGPTLQHYHDMHFDVDALLDEFEQDYNRLLGSIAPSDRFDEETGQTPTIELLFERSVATLSPEGRLAFAGLGVFKHKPATFDAKALEATWKQVVDVDDPKPLILTLIGRGLMEPTLDTRYHVHQTLHMYANKLLDSYDNQPSA